MFLQPPGLWDYNQVSSSAKTWSQLADHVMCGLPHEPAVMHAAGAPASFVGKSKGWPGVSCVAVAQSLPDSAAAGMTLHLDILVGASSASRLLSG